MKLAIIGTGTVVRDNYLPFLARQPDVALRYVNRTRAKAESCAAAFGGTVAVSIAEAMAWEPDAILLLCSETARHELASEALRHRPRRIFFEKPLTARNGQDLVDEEDFARGRALLDDAKAKGSETAMVFNYRFFDQVLAARRLIAERDLGRPVSVAGFVHWACWSHCIDLLALFAGPAVTVSALPSPTAAASGPAPVAASFATALGATGTILRTGSAGFAHPLYELTVGFEHGRLHLRGLDGDLELVDYRRTSHERIGPGSDQSQWKRYDRSFERSLDAYLGSIRAGTPPPIPGDAGLEELRFEAAIELSARIGRAVDLARDLPLQARRQGVA